MSAPLPPLLFVDDDRNARRTFEGMMGAVCPEYEVRTVESAEEALKLLAVQDFFMVITDARLGGMTGYELIKQIKARRPEIPVLMITAYDTSQLAVEAMKSGAIDYLPKPYDPDRLRQAINWSARDYRKTQEIAVLRARIGEAVSLEQIIGECPAMESLRDLIRTVAPTHATVLILGESGTGKELVAGAIHGLSARRERNYVRINCAAIPETLLESELFGHERGAFTGAEQRRIGRFEQAHRGTLFLDEIGDLTPGTQAKLLRVLQEKCIQRLGSNETIPVDVRIITATHRPLEAMIREGRFREDLFYRLSVATIELPPLRARREDVPALAHHFLRKNASEFDFDPPRITPEAVALLQTDPWPGNVRELENVIRRLLLGSRGLPIGGEAVRDVLTARAGDRPPPAPSLPALAADLLKRAQEGQSVDAHAQILAQAEREIVIQAITLAQGNQSQAARWLGLSRPTLREKLTALGLRNFSPDQPQTSKEK